MLLRPRYSRPRREGGFGFWVFGFGLIVHSFSLYSCPSSKIGAADLL